MPTTHPYLQFHARLRDTCKDFFTRYTDAGGDPDNVIVLLWFLTPASQKERIPNPHYPALAQGFKRKLIQLEGACAGLLPYFPTNSIGQIRKLKETVEATREKAREVRRSDKAMRSFLKGWGISGKRGRPSGPLDDTLILATLEWECRARFGRPYHRQLLDLAEAAKRSPALSLRDESNDPVQALRLRLRSVPPAAIETIYQRFFPPKP